jgi:predicted nucleic acid-binding protein
MSIDISSIYKINKDDKVFIDTNILIFLFSPDFVSSKRHQIDKYSAIYGKLIENNCKLFINSHVVSEFINKCLRIDFEKNFQDKETSKDFKRDYRESQRYQDTLSLVLKELKKFISLNVSQLDDEFGIFDIFENYKNNETSDFNDLIIAKIVISNNLKLLSDDGDFNNFKNININWYMN